MIKIPYTAPASTIRIKDEIKYLYTKKTTIEQTALTITHNFGQFME